MKYNIHNSSTKIQIQRINIFFQGESNPLPLGMQSESVTTRLSRKLCNCRKAQCRTYTTLLTHVNNAHGSPDGIYSCK